MGRLTLVLLILFTAGCATSPLSKSAIHDIHKNSDQLAVPPGPSPDTAPPAAAAVNAPAAPGVPVASEPAPLPAPSQIKSVPAATTTAQPPLRKPESTIHAYSAAPVPAGKMKTLVRLAELNEERLANVYVGMYRKNVEDLMGAGQMPFKRQTVAGAGNETYDVVYYLTREPREGRPITDRMLTPVIYKKKQVVAIGYYKLKKLLRTGTLDRPKKGRTEEKLRPAS